MQAVSKAFQNAHYIAVGLFAGLVLLTANFIFNAVEQGFHIDTDLQALIPQEGKDELVQLASERLLEKIGNRVVILLGSNDSETALRAAKMANLALVKNPLLNWPSLDDNNNQKLGLIDLYHRHRHHLMSQEDRGRLIAGNSDTIIRNAMQLLYGLESWSRVSKPTEDPLGIFNNYLISISTGNEIHSVKDGFIILESKSGDGRFYVLLTASLEAGMLDMSAQQAVNDAMQDISERLKHDFPDVIMLRSGMIFHAAQAAEQAKKEASIIAIGSIVGIIVLFMLAFGSPAPLLLSLGSVVFGGLSAFSISSYYFSEIHIITLVFGASLIGVAIDYSLHYFVRLYNLEQVSPRLMSLRIIFPSILLGLITTIIGYGFLIQSALPGLTQIAIFSVSGVIGAWLFVVSVYPYVISRPHQVKHPALLLNLSLLPERFWRLLSRKMIIVVLAPVILFSIVVNLYSSSISDDIRMLHIPSPELIEQGNKIQQIFKNYAPNQFYLVKATSEQQLLVAEEGFHHNLNKLVNSGVIRSYDAITRYLPSIQRQKLNYSLLESSLYSDGGPASRFMDDQGFDSASVNTIKQEFLGSEGKYLLPEEWLVSASDSQSVFWLGKIGAVYASIVTLYGVSDTSILKKAAAENANVIFVDKVESLTNIMGEQRHLASLLLAVAYVAVMLLLLIYYRKLHVASLVCIPLLSTLIALTLLTLNGTAITIFHIFAMFLILGLGMDYSIFIYESPDDDTVCLLAIALSAVTSGLAFGLLSLSSSPMLNAFGLTVLLGSLFNFLLAPLITLLPKKNE